MLDKGDIVGDYTLVRFLGRGQFGEVWLAEKQLKFSNKKVQHALKFLSAAMDDMNVKAAGNEVDTWIEASGHPNVISVLDMMMYKERIVIASEYAEGGSLMDWLTKSGGRAPSHEKALEMMTGILSGIEHLHSRSVVHRDLKPDNILLMGGFPRITDFGISRIISARSLSTVAMGSPFYMSPESFDGNKSTSTDIWSAGVILYEMLSGEHPYRSDTMYGLVSSIKNDLPKPLPSHIEPELRNIVDTALKKDLKDRFSTAEEMRLVIEKEIYGIRSRFNIPTEVMDVPVDIDPGAVTLVSRNFDVTAVLAQANESSETPPPAMTFERPATTTQPPVTTPPPLAPPTAQPNPPLPGVVSDSHLFEKSAQNIYISQAVPPPQPPLASSFETFAKGSGKATTLLEAPVDTISGYQSGGTASGETMQNSQSVKSKKPMLIFAGVGGVMAVALIIGLIAIAAAVREVYLRSSGGKSEATTTASSTSNSAPTAPVPPDGMAYVRGGEFLMGRDNTANPDEKPQHRVKVESFFMDVYEVSNADYKKFLDANPGHAKPSGWTADTFPAGHDKYPVVGVTFSEGQDYASWAGKRLPTEEEWEFAARGTESLLYPWGNEWKPGNANVGSKNFADVGSHPGKSPFGLYDMIGNAWEWTDSEFKPYGKAQNNADPNLKTIRGGSYEAIEESRTTTYRIGWKAEGASTYAQTGFRCAKDVK